MSVREICIHVANHAKNLKSAGHFHKRIKENATQKNIITQAYEIQKNPKRLTMQAFPLLQAFWKRDIETDIKKIDSTLNQ